MHEYGADRGAGAGALEADPQEAGGLARLGGRPVEDGQLQVVSEGKDHIDVSQVLIS